MHRQQGRHPETRREIPGLSIREHTLIAEFDDLRHEWRRLFCEAFGTCLLVVTAAGPGVVDAVSPGSVSRGAAVVAPRSLVRPGAHLRKL